MELGKHSAWNPHNLKGNRENEDIVRFHEKILHDRGYAWDSPPVGVVSWRHDEVDAAREIINSYEGVASWGFKDPRALLLVDGWQQLIPGLRFVGIFRHPLAVAQSFAARQGMAHDKAFSLWVNYNVRLLKLWESQRFPVLCFDEEDAVLLEKLESVISQLGLSGSNEPRFFITELKHHKKSVESLPIELSKIYEKLKAIAL